MKHKIVDDISVDVEHVHSHELPVDQVEQIIDKVVEGAVIIIAAAAVSHIFKRAVYSPNPN